MDGGRLKGGSALSLFCVTFLVAMATLHPFASVTASFCIETTIVYVARRFHSTDEGGKEKIFLVSKQSSLWRQKNKQNSTSQLFIVIFSTLIKNDRIISTFAFRYLDFSFFPFSFFLCSFLSRSLSLSLSSQFLSFFGFHTSPWPENKRLVLPRE